MRSMPEHGTSSATKHARTQNKESAHLCSLYFQNPQARNIPAISVNAAQPSIVDDTMHLQDVLTPTEPTTHLNTKSTSKNTPATPDQQPSSAEIQDTDDQICFAANKMQNLLKTFFKYTPPEVTESFLVQISQTPDLTPPLHQLKQHDLYQSLMKTSDLHL